MCTLTYNLQWLQCPHTVPMCQCQPQVANQLPGELLQTTQAHAWLKNQNLMVMKVLFEEVCRMNFFFKWNSDADIKVNQTFQFMAHHH